MRGLLKTKSAWNQFLVLVSLALVSFFVIGLVGTLVLSSVTGIGIKEMSDLSIFDFNRPGAMTFIRGMQVVQFIGLFLVPVFICARLFSTGSKQYLGLRKPAWPLYFLIGTAVMLFAIPLTNLLGELNRNIAFPSGWESWIKSTEEEASQTVKAVLSRHSIRDLILNVICIAGLAAVGEELLFRGMAQRLLIKMFKSPWAGIIIAAILFSALHMQFYGFIPRFALGILLGAIYWYSGSLWAAMLAHFIYDALLIVVAYYNPGMLEENGTTGIRELAVPGAGSAVVVLVLLIIMKKKSSTRFPEIYAEDSIPVKDHPF